jgi:hypothetical protein
VSNTATFDVFFIAGTSSSSEIVGGQIRKAFCFKNTAGGTAVAAGKWL